MNKKEFHERLTVFQSGNGCIKICIFGHYNEHEKTDMVLAIVIQFALQTS